MVHPRAVFPLIVALADEARGDSTGAVLGQGDMPVVIASGVFHQTTQKTVEIPQLPFFDEVVHISCRGAEADSHGRAVQQTMVIPQLQFLNAVIDVPVDLVMQVHFLVVTSLLCRSCSFPGVVTVAVLGHAGNMPVVVSNRCLRFDSAENCGGSAVAVLRRSSISLSWSRGRFPWSSCSQDHGDSAVAVFSWWSMPCSVLSCSDRGDSTGTVLGSVDDVTGAMSDSAESRAGAAVAFEVVTSLSWRRGRFHGPNPARPALCCVWSAGADTAAHRGADG